MAFNDRGNSFRGGSRGGSHGGGFRGGSSGPREMTKVICSDCGVETEVPFKPNEGRPVTVENVFRTTEKF